MNKPDKINSPINGRLTEELSKRKEVEKKLKAILEAVPDMMFSLTREGIFLDFKPAKDIEPLHSPESFLGENIQKILPFIGDQVMQAIKEALQSKKEQSFEYPVEIDNTKQYFEARVVPINKDEVLGVVRDVTKRKQAEEALKHSKSKLEEQKKTLEEKNIALKEILEQIEMEKIKIKNDVISNIERLILPMLEKIKSEGISSKYLDIIGTNLNDITSSFGSKITNKMFKLTSRETEICNMIKNGLSSKEIANILNLSFPTVEAHRRNIRQKLEIKNKNINLVSYLKGF
ncbi:LuxR C-terminal-related transcriptional regulator [Candidatus Auribacterota bacterium]